MDDYCYGILKATARPEMCGLWNGPVWSIAPILNIDHFRPESTSHQPLVQSKLLYDENCLFGFFLVWDRYVRCIHSGFQAPVYEDSCVELFVQPEIGEGYFNFEFNCGGALLVSYIADPTRINGCVAGTIPFSTAEARRVMIYHSLPSTVEPEIVDEITWSLEFAIPFVLFERYIGNPGRLEGQQWRGNLYKCGDKTSCPHWASWSPLRERNFHAPRDFGVFRFNP